MKKFKNMIIAPYCLKEYLTDKGYKKELVFDRHCPSDQWFYFSKTGQMRTVTKGHIWTSIVDEDGWPSGYIKRRIR